MIQDKRPTYAAEMAKELSKARTQTERVRADLQHRPNPKNRKRLGEAVGLLVDALSRYGQLREAITAQSDWIAELEAQVLRSRSAENQLRLAEAYEKRRELNRLMDRIDPCREDQQKAAEIYAAVAEESGEQTDLCRLGHAKAVLGVFSEDEKREALLDEGFRLCATAAETSEAPENRELLSQVCAIRAAALPEREEECRAVGKRLCGCTHETEAEKLLHDIACPDSISVGDEQLLGVLQELGRQKQEAEESGSGAALAQRLSAAAVSAVGENDRLVQAVAAQAGEIWKELEEKTGNTGFRLDRAKLCLALGKRYAHTGVETEIRVPMLEQLLSAEPELPSPREQALAGSYLEKAWPQLQALEAEGETDVRDAYAACGEALGGLALLAEKPVKAAQLYETVLDVRRELTQTTDYPGCRRAYAMDLRCLAIAREEAELPEQAAAFYEQELEVREAVCADTGRESDRQQLMFVYDALSELCKTMGDFRNARNYILKKSQIG